MLINQSLIKDLIKYKNNQLCGLVFKNKWILHQFGKGSLATKLGQYFEFLATGSLGKGQVKPIEPILTRKNELTSDFKIAKKQSKYFHELIRKFDIKLLDAGLEVVADDKWIGTLDILASWDAVFESGLCEYDEINNENKVIIDLKFSGLLDDKWSEFGWDINMLPKRKGTILQAKHYKFLFWKKYGYNPPFFFFIFDSKKERVCKLIHVLITTEELIKHEYFLENAKSYLQEVLNEGLNPIPTYESCGVCEFNDWCIHKKELPSIITIIPD